MGFFSKVKERKEAFIKLRASNIEKKKKTRADRVKQMKKDNALLRAEAKAKREYKEIKQENFKLNNPRLAKLGSNLKKKIAENKAQGGKPVLNPIFHNTGSSSPFISGGKKGSKKKGDHGKGIFY